MRNLTYLLLVLISFMLISSCTVSKKKFNELNAAKESSDMALAEAQREIYQLANDISALQNSLVLEQERLDQLQRVNEEAEQRNTEMKFLISYLHNLSKVIEISRSLCEIEYINKVKGARQTTNQEVKESSIKQFHRKISELDIYVDNLNVVPFAERMGLDMIDLIEVENKYSAILAEVKIIKELLLNKKNIDQIVNDVELSNTELDKIFKLLSEDNSKPGVIFNLALDLSSILTISVSKFDDYAK